MLIKAALNGGRTRAEHRGNSHHASRTRGVREGVRSSGCGRHPLSRSGPRWSGESRSGRRRQNTNRHCAWPFPARPWASAPVRGFCATPIFATNCLPMESIAGLCFGEFQGRGGSASRRASTLPRHRSRSWAQRCRRHAGVRYEWCSAKSSPSRRRNDAFRGRCIPADRNWFAMSEECFWSRSRRRLKQR